MPDEPTAEVDDPIAVSVEKAAKRIGLGKRTLYRIIEEDPTFPAYKVGRRTLVSVQGLREWDAKRRQEAAA